MSMFIDTHCHLYDEELIENVDEIIDRALKVGVEKMVVAGCDISSSLQCISLAKKYEQVYVCVGFYPEYANDFDEKAEQKLRELAKEEKVVAIGEIGLDKSYDVSMEKQKEVLLRQIKLAKEFNLPIVLHGRDCYGEIFDMLRQNKEILSGGTFHCYTGSIELAREIEKLGFYISVGGVSTFANAKNVRQMVAGFNLDRIILETDSPYLAPTPVRGKINEPCFIPYIAQNLAELKDVSVGEIEEKTTQNARRLFGI